MGVYELSGAGSVTTPRTNYKNMNANNQFGAMVPIQSFTLASSGSFSFTNIPQIYQDLMLVAYVRSNTSGTNAAGISIYLNGASTTDNYSVTRLLGDGSNATTGRSTTSGPTFGLTPGDAILPSLGNTSGIFGSAIYHIINYASTTTSKTAIIRTSGDANGSGRTTLNTALWANNAAISSLLLATNGAWIQGSQATLYGIRASNS